MIRVSSYSDSELARTVHVIAFVSALGPVLPPIIIVIPAAKASSTCCGQMCVDGIGGDDEFSTSSVEEPMMCEGWTFAITSRLAALPIPVISPFFTPMSAL